MNESCISAIVNVSGKFKKRKIEAVETAFTLTSGSWV